MLRRSLLRAIQRRTAPLLQGGGGGPYGFPGGGRGPGGFNYGTRIMPGASMQRPQESFVTTLLRYFLMMLAVSLVFRILFAPRGPHHHHNMDPYGNTPPPQYMNSYGQPPPQQAHYPPGSASNRPPPPQSAPYTTAPPDHLAYWDGQKWVPLTQGGVPPPPGAPPMPTAPPPVGPGPAQ
eukprot:TRINITY_DN4330_c0_g1_i2.p3 TRINITY_DN4330_c0_g1~~TRINITY_DN4330_c0_g1_i2.p3  ORF type:complete len:179 (+),score=46.74 TRINITY_DN4330_c0_g1_i2:81-617(+)